MSGQLRAVSRRYVAMTSVVVAFVSLIVVGTASPVAASTLGGNHKGTASSFSLVGDQNNCSQFLDVDGDGISDYSNGEAGGSGSSGGSGESGTSGGSSGGSGDSGSGDSGSSGGSGGSGTSGGSSGGSGDSGSSGGSDNRGGIIRPVVGVVRAGESFVANAAVLSYSVSFDDGPGVIDTMTCAMTDESGEFFLNVVDSGGFGEVVISPPFTANYGTQLGSVSRLIMPTNASPPSILDLGFIDLEPANNLALFYSRTQADIITAPSNIICHSFYSSRSSNDADITGGCAVARGLTTPSQNVVAMKTLTSGSNSQVRFYLAPGSTTLVPSAFVINGLPSAYSNFNGRWAAPAFGPLPTEDIDGDGGLAALSYVTGTYGGTPTPTNAVVAFEAPYPTLQSVTWAAATTLAANTKQMTSPGEFVDVNLADGVSRDAQVVIFSRNRVGSGTDVSEQFRYIRASNTPDTTIGEVSFCGSTPPSGCNPYTALTTPGSVSTTWGRGVITWLDSSSSSGGSGSSGSGGSGSSGSGGGDSCGPTGSGNYQGVVVTALSPEAPFTNCGYVSASPFSATAWGGGPGWDHATSSSGTVLSNGQFVLSLAPSSSGSGGSGSSGGSGASGASGDESSTTKVFRLEFGPFTSTTIAPARQVVRVTFESGSTTITQVETCASFSLDSSISSVDARCTAGWVLATPSSTRYVLHAPPANFVGQVRLPDGTPLAPSPASLTNSNTTYVSVSRLKNYITNYAFSGDGEGAPTKTDGKFLLHLTPGSYQLEIQAPTGLTYPQLKMYVKVTESDGAPVIERCSTFNDREGTLGGCETLSGMSWATPLTTGLQFTAGDMTGKGWATYTAPGSGSNVAASGFWVEVHKKSDRCPPPNSCYDYDSGTSANSGTFSLSFTSSGEYKLFLNPPWTNSAGLTRTEVIVTVTITDGVKSLVVAQNGSPVAKDSNGVYNFVYNSANFVALVTNPSNNPVSNSWVSVQELSVQSGGMNQWANFTSWVDSARTDSDGKARMSFSRAGYFKIVASNPTTDPYPELVRYLKVEVSGGVPTYYACSDFQSSLVDRAPSAGTFNDSDADADIDDALECSTTAVAATSGTPLAMQFVGAEFTGQVSGASNFWVEIRRLNTTLCENCDEYVGGTMANQNGVFGITFATTGTYKLAINPPWNDTSGATRTEISVVVAGASGSRTFTVTRGSTTITPVSGVYSFVLNSANFRGLVKKGSTAEAYSNVSFEKWNSDFARWEWSTAWANTNASGQFSTTLTDGTWKITARPSWQSEGTASPVTVYTKIVSEAVSSGGVATTQACAEATPSSGDGCTRLSVSEDRYQFSLGTPNFSGYAAVASDSSRDVTGVPASAAALSFSWMEVQVWNEFEQQYRWSPDVPGINTASDGRFAATLPAGDLTTNPSSKYQITLNPRPQDVAAGRSRGTFKVYVVGGVVRCEQNYGSWCTANSAPTGNRFDLHLSAANFTGTVTAGSLNVVNGNVNAQKWNGQWFEWLNLWAQTGSSGRFAMNLDTDGIYKVTAEAPTWNNAYAGFANVSKYVKVAAGVICEVASETSTSCITEVVSGVSEPTPDGDLDVAMALAGANVRGQVTQTGGATVGNTWVNVMRYNSTLGWWEWLTGAPVNSSGAFSLSLVPATDGDRVADGTQQRFKIEVMPPWGNSTLTRKEVQLWVGAVGQVSGDNYYRVCAKSALSDCTGLGELTAASGNDALEPATLAVLLSAGNVTGTVTSNGTTGMPYSWINVEKWMTPSWASQPMWQWVELFGNANQYGDYSLPLDGQGDGYYRITANPGWNNPLNLTRTSVTVKQAEGLVCRVSSATDASCDDGASAAYDLDIQLAGSNLAGSLLNSGSAVPNAWIGLMQEQNGPTGVGADSATRSNTWYQWLGGANTAASGTFGVRLESEGRYQLEINPPWNLSLSRFSVYLYAKDSDPVGDEGPDGVIEANEIYVCGSKSQSNVACAALGTIWSAGSNSQLSFPTPNVAIRVCDKDDSGSTCNGVANAWVVVFLGNEWITGANTNSAGIAQFRLDDGVTYRFEANPNWANPDGSRVETAANISVTGGVLQPPPDADLSTEGLQPESPIVGYSSGDKRIDIRLGSPNVTGTVYYRVAGTPTAMPFAYIGVRRSDGTYLPGAPVNASGAYAIALANGTYTLTAYPNGNIAERAPTSISVTVAGGVVTGGCPCNLDFDAVTPNVNFTMTNMGTFTRTLFVYQGDTLVTSIAKAPVSGSVALSFALPAGTYSLRMQQLNTFATDGSSSLVDFNGANGDHCRTFTLTIDEDLTVSNSTDPATWADGFIGDDAGPGLECKNASS